MRNKIKATVKNAQNSKSYVPCKQDYVNLLALCCADATAQSPTVMIDGVGVDTRNNKIQRMISIKRFVETHIKF